MLNFYLFCLWILCLILSLVFSNDLANLEIQAIERGYALHCPVDGQWAWKGECQ